MQLHQILISNDQAQRSWLLPEFAPRFEYVEIKKAEIKRRQRSGLWLGGQTSALKELFLYFIALPEAFAMTNY
jgi:hypothetical protein